MISNKVEDLFLALDPGNVPLQWTWTGDGPRIDPRPREEYLAEIRQRWHDEDVNEMYSLMERYPDQAREWIETFKAQSTEDDD